MERLLNTRPTDPVLALIGGLDTRAAAGLLADLRAVQDAGVLALAVPTALTIQPRNAATTWSATPAKQFASALAALFADHAVAAVKIGMVANAAQARAIAQALPEGVPVVWDPVLATSRSVALYRGRIAALRPLARRATLVTPNVPEAEALALVLTGARLLKGGHARGRKVVDVLTIEGRQHRFEKVRLPYSVRGTGCALASRIAAELAHGRPLLAAVNAAERWMDKRYRGCAP